MRDYLILAIILGSAPICLFNPYFGVLMWAWVAYFNPHRYAWGFAYHFPVASVIAIPTLLGMLFSRQRNRRVFTRETVLLLLLWLWFAFTVYHATTVPIFADHVAGAREQLGKVSKVFVMTLVTVLLVNSEKKLKYLFLVTAFSFGVRAVVGAIFAIQTEGVFRVYGPGDSFIEDNNAFALALNMTLPMLFFLAREEQGRWLRLCLRIAFYAGIICVVFTYSRGGLLGLAVVLAVLAIQSHKKGLAVALLLAGIMLIVTFAPAEWMARMAGFVHGNVDESAQGRLDAWEFAWTLTKHYPLTGGSFVTFTPGLFERFTPHIRLITGPHSIYFQMLGEHGYVGLGLFLLLLSSCWSSLRRIQRRTPKLPTTAWLATYTRMLEASMLAYMVSGAFLALAYFDLLYQLVASTIILRVLYRQQVTVATQAEERNAVTAGVGEPAMP